MRLNEPLIEELKKEAAATRKLLERVPVDNSDWKPHPKSMTLGRLAMHVAEIMGWVSMTMLTEELDMTQLNGKMGVATDMEILLAKHDEHTDQALAVLENSTDEDFMKTWTMRSGEVVYYTLPRYAAVRQFAFSHLIHHRAQLGMYLRLLDVAIPGMYGPTADEIEARKKAAAATA